MTLLSIVPVCALLAASLCTSLGHAEGMDHPVEEQVRKIERNYDLDGAERLLDNLQGKLRNGDTGDGLRLQLARTALVAAMLHRMAYEEAANDYAARRELGRKIDDAATAGLGALKEAGDSSERFRLEADLWGTMMRTQARGSQYRHYLEDATERALELGPKNPNAYVTASKRKLFASARRGGDIDEALEMLNTALKLDPKNELALVFRGLAHEKLGELEVAQQDWRQALEVNPDSVPAQDNLERVEAGRPQPYDEP